MNLRGVQLLTTALWLVQPALHAQSLPQLIDGVLTTHPSMRSQRALGDSAKEAVEGAKWQFYPTPSIGFEQVDASHADPNYPAYGDKSVTTLRLQQPLWTGGRLTAGLDRAQAGVVASQASLDSVRQDLALRVLQFYADWYGALLKRQAYEKSLKAHRTLQDQINRRIAGGVSPQSDLTLLLGRAQQTEADLSTAQAQEQSALGRLNQLLGHSLQARDLSASLSTPQAIAASAQELLEHAQAHNPGVIKLRAQAQIAEAEVTSAKADLKPEVYLRAESQYGNRLDPRTNGNTGTIPVQTGDLVWDSSDGNYSTHVILPTTSTDGVRVHMQNHASYYYQVDTNNTNLDASLPIGRLATADFVFSAAQGKWIYEG
ncbi:hypothetical protein DIC66_00755 [Rhodoferax lacus]|uniref:Metalloprotease StcE beta-sandwich domain-containing protein n=1 Tax=Rhodoferax lacus TaxID=2184758 RepID=A0A3E1RGE9_9BURK|nr:TolC family protein [Rhodoferax lacus]RFO98455.1 hypothetical protein DIC66_00755 [Rhodoferax lacus]